MPAEPISALAGTFPNVKRDLMSESSYPSTESGQVHAGYLER